MTYANLLSREETEQRIRELHEKGYKVRDLASLFGLHPEIIKRVIEAKEQRGVPSDLGAIDSDPAVGRRPLLNP